MKKIDWNQQELKMLLNSNCIDSDKSLNHKTAVKNTNKESPTRSKIKHGYFYEVAHKTAQKGKI